MSYIPPCTITSKILNLTNKIREEVFNFQPKSFLIIGKLDEFKNKHGVNSDKYRSFELFRKNIFSPEIITFDELYERAKFIVNQQDGVSQNG